MHDLLFTYDFPPMGGGIARWMEALVRTYPPGELLVSTGTLPGAAAIDAGLPNPVDRIAVPSERLRTLPGRLRWSYRAASLAGNPAARFAWCGTLRPAAYPAAWARRRTGLPYGVMLYGGDILILREKLQRTPWKRRQIAPLLGNASALVTISHWTTTECLALLQQLGIGDRAAAVHQIPPGTDAIACVAAPAEIAAFRQRIGLPANARCLLTVARLVPHKGADTGIRVLAALATEFPSLHYLIVGRGPAERALHALAMELGVVDRVRLLTDVSDADLPLVYQCAEVYLGLSRQTATDVEGFGISLLEAAAAGLPTIAGASGGVADAIRDGETGWLVDPVAPDAAVAATRNLLLDPLRARQMGEAGRLRVARDFTWRRVVDDFRRIAAGAGRIT